MTATADDFRAAGANERVQIAETLMITWILGTRPGQPVWFDGNTRLSDLAIDSIQLVELKFALDQLAGVELDVNVFITNPTVRELAEHIAAVTA
ncbi:MAG TPA: acyl carrier protein [Vicinamibacterales bacterium]|nr:acyl carrier protein [Vicinamibacterales bacterium]